jgi:hypothetical protein
MGKVKMETDQQSKLMLAYLCIATEVESSLRRKVEILGRFGLTSPEIARVCGCSERAVQMARQQISKR